MRLSQSANCAEALWLTLCFNRDGGVGATAAQRGGCVSPVMMATTEMPRPSSFNGADRRLLGKSVCFTSLAEPYVPFTVGFSPVRFSFASLKDSLATVSSSKTGFLAITHNVCFTPSSHSTGTAKHFHSSIVLKVYADTEPRAKRGALLCSCLDWLRRELCRIIRHLESGIIRSHPR
jgi:hypothetical protein